MKILLLIASGNLEPLIISAQLEQPQKLMIVVTSAMAAKAQRLAEILQTKLPNCDLEQMLEMSDSEPAGIYARAEEISDAMLNQFDANNASFVFNVNGGTKLMTTIFQEVFLQHLDNCMTKQYVDTAAAKVFRYKDATDLGGYETSSLPSLLDMETYFKAHDRIIRPTPTQTEEWSERALGRKEVTKLLARECASSGGDWVLGQLNSLIRGQANSVLQPGPNRTEIFHRGLYELAGCPQGIAKKILRELNGYNLLGWDSEQPRAVFFHDPEYAVYLAGGWLEEYAWLCAKDASADHVCAGVKVSSIQGRRADAHNELDCVVIHRNRMLIMECKTAVYRGNGDKEQDVMHKLLSLSEQTSGLFGERAILSARAFGNGDNLERNVARAKSMNITLVQSNQLTQLTSNIKLWMDGEHFSVA